MSDSNRSLHEAGPGTPEDQRGRVTDRYQAVVDALPDMMFVFDHSGRFLDYHAPNDAELAAPPEFFLNKSITELFPEDIASQTQESITAALREGTLQRFEYSLETTVGIQLFEARMTASSSGEVITLVRDITEQRQLEQSLLHRSAHLQQSNEDLQRFSYVAAHDLRGPLQQIIGYTQVIEDQYGEAIGEMGNEFLSQVVSGTQRMADLITSLLESARIGHQQEEPKEVDLSQVLQEVVAEFGDLEPSLKIGPMPAVVGHEVRLRQVFRNLIGNADKFRSPERELKLSIGAREEEEYHVIEVVDNGIGFDMEAAADLFEPFQRLHQSGPDGSGVGLSICRRIMETHGGSIEGRGEPDSGATFVLRFPRIFKSAEVD